MNNNKMPLEKARGIGKYEMKLKKSEVYWD